MFFLCLGWSKDIFKMFVENLNDKISALPVLANQLLNTLILTILQSLKSQKG